MKRTLFWSVLLLLCFSFSSESLRAQEIDFDQIPLEEFKPEVKSAADSVLFAIDHGSQKVGKEAFADFLRKYRKNGDQMYRAARYFMEKNRYYCAEICMKKANEIYDKHLDVLRLKVELYSKLGTDVNEVGAGYVSGAYDEILRVDSADLNAIRGIAFVNRYQNPYMSIEYYDKLLNLLPDDAEAHKFLGFIYHRMDSTKYAIKHYGHYYKVTPADSLEEYHMENYVNRLFAEKKYNEAIKACRSVESHFPKNKVFKSIKFWGLVENLKKEVADMQLPTAAEREQMYRLMGADADAAMRYIVNKEFADSAYNYWDYAFAAELNGGQGKHAAAINFQRQALDKDSTRAAAYQLMSQYLQDNKQFVEALPYYKTYIAKLKELNRAQPSDTMRLGLLYVDLAKHESDSVKFSGWLQEADDIFAYISDTQTSHLGPILRARLVRDLSRPHQEAPEYNTKGCEFFIEAIRRMGSEEKFNTEKGEGLQYLIMFNINEKKYPEALEYLLEFSKIYPDNEWAKELIPALKSAIVAGNS